MTDNEPTEKLVSRKELMEATGLSAKGLTKIEKVASVSAVISDGRAHYTVESAELLKAMMLCQGRCANLKEAYKIALQGMSSKKRRNDKLAKSSEGDNDHKKTMDPKKIKPHPRFEGLFDIDDDLTESLTVDIAVGGYYRSQAIVVGTWPGLEEPVLIDGHTRRKAAIAAGMQQVPVDIEEFDDEDGALRYIANVQTKRRPTDDWVRYQLISELDSLMDRGGDRRSEQAKSKGPDGPIETGHSTSAERTAALVGCSPRTVKRARRIRKEATPAILEALKKHKMKISQAEKAVADKAKDKKTTREKLSKKISEAAEKLLKKKNLVTLKAFGGNLVDHINEAVEQYIELRKRSSSEQQDSEVDDRKPGSSNDTGAATE